MKLAPFREAFEAKVAAGRRKAYQAERVRRFLLFFLWGCVVSVIN
jgi:hypothetical protein